MHPDYSVETAYDLESSKFCALAIGVDELGHKYIYIVIISTINPVVYNQLVYWAQNIPSQPSLFAKLTENSLTCLFKRVLKREREHLLSSHLLCVWKYKKPTSTMTPVERWKMGLGKEKQSDELIFDQVLEACKSNDQYTKLLKSRPYYGEYSIHTGVVILDPRSELLE